ncbi:TadE/TadG family type IV pilus assembly protein [Magnetospira sp. QH-2]|uniref:TadE/TadG family type IV pilus assembly protein n=1 Tax=Magnetospira sp. (strain QH-2) TaxID=1288970 RepID=UPI0003E81840|nr:TadE/TadG family type IV pilus assembly protein [Magnetospira sp. QH-2]CCQ74287.1 Protein of unknown function [Magnetospira sp. QH-2]
MNGLLKRFARDVRGVLALEVAFAVPVLLGLILSGVEITRYILLNQKIERATMTVADLVSQAEVLTGAEVDNLFVAGDFVMEPFDVNAEGQMIVSSVVGSGSGAVVAWQRTYGGGTGGSQFGVAGGTATLPAGFFVAEGESFIAAEVFYDYAPMFMGGHLVEGVVGNVQLYNSAVFRPRFTSIVAYSP